MIHNKKGLNTVQIIAAIVMLAVVSTVAVLQLTGTINILGNQRDFCSDISDRVLCGICNKDIKLSDNPYAGQCRFCPAGTTCSGDVCGDINCIPSDGEPDQITIGDLSGTWKGTMIEELHGPEGSFPPGCTIQQTVELYILQDGNALGGTITTTMTGGNCAPAVPSSLIGITATAQLSGTVSGSSITFSSEDKINLGAADFTATVEGDVLSGKIVTCHSPDQRCTCNTPDPRCPGGFDKNGTPLPGKLETVNWWTGDFFLTRTK